MRCTMKLPIATAFVYISITNIVYVCAKVHGGPRGRFDKVNHRTPVANHHVSSRHTHFSYHPPSHISFMCRYCGSMVSYPVYHGLPPTYVYKYRESGTRFGDLLTGLALYNLGRASEHWHHTHYYTHRLDENCSLQVIDRSHFEETPVPCFMMSTFLREETQGSLVHGPDSFDVTSSHINVKPIQSTGSPLQVTRDQECVIWHNTTMNQERNTIPCALLKEYANTMKPAGLPVYIWLPVTLGIVLVLSICCQCCCRKRKEVVEEAPINQKPVVGYCLNIPN